MYVLGSPRAMPERFLPLLAADLKSLLGWLLCLLMESPYKCVCAYD